MLHSDQTNAAITARADAIYGDRIAAVNAWGSSKSGAKHLVTMKSTMQSL